MTDTPQASGADLARQALAAARANAKNTPAAGPKKPRRTVRAARGEGRDPQGLAGILGRLTAEQGWTDQLGGGDIMDRWPELCPTAYAESTRPVGYDQETGTLTIRTASHTVAAGLRLAQLSLAKTINDKLGRTVVRQLRIRVGADGPGTRQLEDLAPAPAPAQEPPVRTRETASPGYHAALEAALTHRPERQPTNPYILEAIARQEAALRAKRQPEFEHRDAVWELDRLQAAELDRDEAVRRAAIARARAERAAGGTLPRRVFDVA